MRKSIIALSIVALAIGTVYLYVGLRAYLFPQVRGQFMMGGVCAIVGSLMLIAGMILMILGVTSKLEKMTSLTSTPSPKRRAEREGKRKEMRRWEGKYGFCLL